MGNGKNTLSGKYDQKRYASAGGAKQEISGGAKIKMNFQDFLIIYFQI